jgi:hypothetical protein
MNIEGVNHQFSNVPSAKFFEGKTPSDKPPIGLIPSAIDASEKILASHPDPAQTEIHVDLEA